MHLVVAFLAWIVLIVFVVVVSIVVAVAIRLNTVFVDLLSFAIPIIPAIATAMVMVAAVY
jgi:hypothetical protein